MRPVHFLIIKTLLSLTRNEENNHFIPRAFPIFINIPFVFPQMLPDIRFSFGEEIKARSEHEVIDAEKC